MNDIIRYPKARQSEQLPASPADNWRTPQLVNDAGPAARFAYEEFIYAKLRNPSTRKNYHHSVKRFLAAFERQNRPLTQIMPRDVGEYLDGLPFAPATKKLHLAALRHFFDTLVNRHVIVLNPASSVRGERLQVIEGKTPEIGVMQARKLLRSFPPTDIVALRDRAILGILIYTAARVGAIARLRIEDFYDTGNQHCLRFHEKGGKSREIPCRHDLQLFLAEYIGQFCIIEKKSPLFRTANRRTKQLTQSAMTTGDITRMVKRRCRRAHLSNRISPHSFRVTTITDLLTNGASLQDVQNLAGHADPRTTRLYDRRHRQVSRNIVERISV